MIKITSGENGITRVFQDGNEIKHIREVRFIHNALDKKPQLLISFAEDKIEIDAKVVPDLPEFYKPFYELKSNEPPEGGSNAGKCIKDAVCDAFQR